MSKHYALAVSLITMLADMYQDHANEDEENARARPLSSAPERGLRR